MPSEVLLQISSALSLVLKHLAAGNPEQQSIKDTRDHFYRMGRVPCASHHEARDTHSGTAHSKALYGQRTSLMRRQASDAPPQA